MQWCTKMDKYEVCADKDAQIDRQGNEQNIPVSEKILHFVRCLSQSSLQNLTKLKFKFCQGGGTTKRTRQGLFSKSCLCFAGKENYTFSQRPCCSLFDRLPSPGNSFTHTARHNSMTFKAILIGKAED